MISRPGFLLPKRARRLNPVWWVGLTTLVIVLAAVFAVIRLNDRAVEERQASTYLAQMDRSLLIEGGMEWYAFIQSAIAPETAAALDESRAQTLAALAGLRALKGDDRHTQNVVTSIESVHTAVDEALANIAAGTESQASQFVFHTSVITPRFASAIEAVATTRAAYDARARQAERIAVIGAAGSLVTAALIAGLMFWRALHISRRSAVLAAEQRAAQASEARFRALVQNATDIVAVVDPAGFVQYISPAAEHILGAPPAHWLGQSLIALVHPDDVESVRATEDLVNLAADDVPSLTVRVRHQNGEWRFLEVLTRNLLADPHVGGIVLNARDVTERKGLESELSRQAFSDALTGLPNRALLIDRLTHALARGERLAGAVAVLYLDLDNFKLVNDSLGHEAGDALLAAVATRLQNGIRTGDTLARLGGDEFIILLEDIAGSDEAIEVACRILDAVAAPFPLHDREIFVNVSIGIALSTPDCDASDLLRDADTAMYVAKRRGKAGYELFTPEMHAQSANRLMLETTLRHALDRREFELHYQPVVDLASGRIAEMEALLRWRHPERGLLYPGDFIPIAEETGLILPIGRWVLAEAAHQTRTWQHQYPSQPPLTVSVNLSARQFQDGALMQDVTDILAETGLSPDNLKLEITESALIENVEETVATLTSLKHLGVRVAIDDFGTGYSSLAYLQQFPVDILKIDRSFVQRLEGRSEATALARNIVDLGKALHLTVTGEGIETGEQLAALRELGCEQGQGYYFDRPMCAEALGALLAARTSYSMCEAGDEAA